MKHRKKLEKASVPFLKKFFELKKKYMSKVEDLRMNNRSLYIGTLLNSLKHYTPDFLESMSELLDRFFTDIKVTVHTKSSKGIDFDNLSELAKTAIDKISDDEMGIIKVLREKLKELATMKVKNLDLKTLESKVAASHEMEIEYGQLYAMHLFIGIIDKFDNFRSLQHKSLKLIFEEYFKEIVKKSK